MIKQISISFIVSTLVLLGFYYFVPVWDLDGIQTEMLGATITEISSTDQISNFPAVYNANLNALNSAKIEVSTTTLPNITTLENLVTVGTLTTGTWNADTLTVAYGGTGSTTLLSNAVLLGNGTSGIKAVSGYGTSGQFLTSNGAGSAPTWQTSAVALGDDYAWTGNHHFNTGTTTFNGQTYLNDVNIASGTLNEYPTASTSIVTKGYSDKIRYYTASDTYTNVGSTAEETDTDTSYKLEKQVRVFYPGVVRVKFEIKADPGSNNVYGRVYVNDVAVGAEHAMQATSYTEYEDDIYIRPGDKIQLYVKCGASETVYSKNFKIYGTLNYSDIPGLSDD